MHGQMRAELLDDLQVVDGNRRHRRVELVVAAHSAALRESEQRAAAPRADLLIVVAPSASISYEKPSSRSTIARSRTIIAEANGCAAAAAPRLLAARAGVLVEAHAELRRPLEDMEQLSERQPQQREDHGDGVEDGEEVVARSPSSTCSWR